MQQFFSKPMAYGPVITTSSPLPSGEQGFAYPSVQFKGANGTQPYSFSLVSGALPSGLTLSSSGLLSGTPTANGAVIIGAQIIDAGGALSNVYLYSLTIVPQLAISSSSTLTAATERTAYSFPFTATGGTGPYTWAPVGGFAMFDGATYGPVTLNSSGVFSGTANRSGNAIGFVTVTDALGYSVTSPQLSWHINSDLAITTTGLLNGTVSSSYSQQINISGGDAPYTYSVSATGTNTYSISNTGLLTANLGATAETDQVTVGVVDANLGNVTKAFNVVVNATGTVVKKIGAYMVSGGGNSYSYEGFPHFQDMFRWGRWINKITGSITNSVFTVTGTLNNANNISIGSRLYSPADFQPDTARETYVYILKQLTGTTGGIGTYQLNNYNNGTVISMASKTIDSIGGSVAPILTDAAGWPTTDFQYLLYEGSTTLSWSTAGTGLFACGFTSKGTGTETISGSNCTISNKAYNAGTKVVTFDLRYNGTGPVQMIVTGTTGGVTNIFIYQPAYRGTAYSAASLFTTEAITHYSQYSHIRDMEPASAWPNSGWPLFLAAPVASGALSATLTTPFPFATGAYVCVFPNHFNGAPLDTRSIVLTNGSTTINWAGALTKSSYAVFMPNNAQTRNTPANTKCSKGWGTTDGYPKEWHLDLAKACGVKAYCNIPLFDDTGLNTSYAQDFATIASSTYAGTPIIVEVDNELWGGAGAQLMSNLSTFDGTTSAVYLAKQLHSRAAVLRTAYGANFNSQVNLSACWQTGGNGLDFFVNLFNYYDTQTWVPSADLKSMSVAAYWNTTNATITASIAATGVMTVTAIAGAIYNLIDAQAAVTGNASITAGTVISSQLSGYPGSTGTYQLSTSGYTVASQSLTCKLATTSTISQIQQNITRVARYAANIATMENITALALSRGLQSGSYEGSWQVNAESSTITNIGASKIDAGFKAVFDGHLQGILNAGLSHYTVTSAGVSGTGGNTAPGNELTTVYPPTAANSPMFASMAGYNTTTFVPTKNVINGIGSIIQGYNWCDNLDSTALGSLSFGSFKVEPYYHNSGYVPYIVNVTAAGSYNIDVTFSGVSGTPKTSFQLDATIVGTNIAVVNGVVRVASALNLTAGSHLLLLGQNGAQTATITQIQLN